MTVGIPVLTAVTDAAWEAALVAAVSQGGHELQVVRRCVDLAELLATAAAGTARAVLLSADLRRLDADALGRLAAAGVAVVGLVEPGDESAERMLRQLGVGHVLASDVPVDAVVEAVRHAVLELQSPGAAAERAGPGSAPTRPIPFSAAADPGPTPAVGERLGRIIAVWGPTGAPGRTTVAVGLADEAVRLKVAALLVDADVYGGSVGQALGLLDESPGLAAAARLHAGGQLDVPALAALARLVGPGLRVLTGITRPDRWPELRPPAVRDVLERCRQLAALTVVDCGFCLEQDEELAYDTLAPRRNGATLAALESADVVLAVGTADPVGLLRLLRGLGELRDAVPGAQVRVVVNRLRGGVIAGSPRREVAAALARHAGLDGATFLPYDPGAADRALGTGRTLADAAPAAPLRRGLRGLAAELVEAPLSRGRRRRRRAG